MTDARNIEKTFDFSRYDYLDFGCSNGNSIDFGAVQFGGHTGLGIDIDPEKIATAQNRIKNNIIPSRHGAICADLIDLHQHLPSRQFRFVTCIHFMEHLPGFRTVQQILYSAAHVSREFVFAVQPNADRSQYLFEQGLKTYYSDWTCHTALLTSYDFYRLCKNFQLGGVIKDFVIYKNRPVLDSSDPCIHPLASPKNQHDYDPNVHPAKEEGLILDNVYQEIGLFMLRSNVPVEKYLKTVSPNAVIIYDSREH